MFKKLQGICTLGPIFTFFCSPKINEINTQLNYVFTLLINPIAACVKRHVMGLKSLPLVPQSADNMRDGTSKSVFRVIDQVRLKLAYSTTAIG